MVRRRGEERGGKRGGPRHEKENQGNGKKTTCRSRGGGLEREVETDEMRKLD